MKNKVLMSLVLLALIGTSAIFAQSPTLDKLAFGANGTDALRAGPKDKNITGAVVVPGEYNGKPVNMVADFNGTKITSVIILEGVTRIQNIAFDDCTELTSVTCPASLKQVGSNAFNFNKSAKLTSITFLGGIQNDINGSGFGNNNISNDLIAKYKAGGPGTYTRAVGGTVWTKQGGFSLNGVWTRSDGMKITIADNGQNITITGDKPNNGGKLNDTYAKR